MNSNYINSPLETTVIWKIYLAYTYNIRIMFADTPDEHKQFVMSLKPKVTFTRHGDSIQEKYEFDIGYSVENTIKFGEEHEGIDKSEPKKFHNMVSLLEIWTPIQRTIKVVILKLSSKFMSIKLLVIVIIDFKHYLSTHCLIQDICFICSNF